MRPPRARVAIVGGGIGGLTLAAALHPDVAEVTLYEAQPERVTGAALGLWPSAWRALEGLGVRPPSAGVDTRVELHRLDGRRLVTVPSPRIAQVVRPKLMQALAAAVPPSVRRVAAEITQPEELDADVVVGADGVRSRVRRLVDPAAADRVATPWVTLRGITSAAEMMPGHAREYWGAGCLFGDAPLSHGRYWFTAHRSDLGPEPLDPAAVRAEALAVFAGAAPEVLGPVESATDDAVLATRLWIAPAMRRYRRGRYVVIGDAAHASLPNLARGASDAVLDAVTLAAALTGGRSLSGWEARRVPLTQASRAGAGVLMAAALRGAW